MTRGFTENVKTLERVAILHYLPGGCRLGTMAIFERTAHASSPTGWKLVKFREQVGARHYRHIAEKTLLIVEDDEFNFVYPIWPSNTKGANPVDNANRWYQTALGRHEVQTDFGPYLGTLEEKNASGYRGFGS